MRHLLGYVLLVFFTVAGAQAADDPKLRPLTSIYVDGEGSAIHQPEGVGCRGGPGLIVADSGNGRLLRYEVTEDLVRPAGTIVVAQMSRPIHAEITSNGEILALDGKQRKILRIGDAGQFLGYLEPQGTSGAIGPRSFKIDRDDNVYVLDILSARILVIEPSGAVLREIAFPQQRGIFSDLTIDSRGIVYVIDTVAKRVYSAATGATELSPAAEDLEGKAEFPTSIAADDAGNLFVGDQNGGSILVLGTDGSFRGRQSGMGWSEKLLRYPSKICIDSSDHLFVADRANNRVQVFAIIR